MHFDAPQGFSGRLLLKLPPVFFSGWQQVIRISNDGV
jgi:hypothetical protein